MQQARYYLLGERAVVLQLEPPVNLESQQRIWHLTQQLRSHSDVADIVAGMNNLTVVLKTPQLAEADATGWLQQHWEKSEALPFSSKTVDIPVLYGGPTGPDLDDVARHCEMRPTDVVDCHTSVDYLVYFIGFQPGFPYLAGLDPRLHTPRRAEPRLQVPAGSVGIGGAQTGVYSLTTPGGWQIIGRTQIALFTPDRLPPALLRPGDRVRFVPQKGGVC